MEHPHILLLGEHLISTLSYLRFCFPYSPFAQWTILQPTELALCDHVLRYSEAESLFSSFAAPSLFRHLCCLVISSTRLT